MFEIEWTFGWTLAAVAAGWLVFSFAAALFFGRLIGQSSRAMHPFEPRELPAPSTESGRFVDVWADDDVPYDDVYDPSDEAGTRATGTRIKPVHLRPEPLPEPLPEGVRRIR